MCELLLVDVIYLIGMLVCGDLYVNLSGFNILQLKLGDLLMVNTGFI